MPTPDRVAIIGIGATLPGALNPQFAWENQLARRCSIERVPTEVWDTKLFHDPTRNDKDGVYTDLGAFVRGFSFKPQQFKMPPAAVVQMDPIHKVSLVTAQQALLDAGIDGPTDGIRAAVILGNLQGGTLRRGDRWLRLSNPTLVQTLEGLPGFQALTGSEKEGIIEEFAGAWRDQFPQMTGDSLCGVLGNIAAARVAHHFNFHGPNNVIDAACASSLAALESASATLLSGRVDLAITGGVDMTMDVCSYSAFCAMGALSQEGSYPFDVRASGFVMGEGAVFFVLKRLSDARRDGDRVYAVVSGIGSSSDGRGRSIVAPNPDGQVRAMQDAWKEVGKDPASVGYVEAHGTATPLGDPTETQAMREVFGAAAQGSIPMGSIKANIGHLKGAAGAAGMLRAIMALHTRTIPPQAGFETPNPHCEFDKSPLRIPTEAADWKGDGRLASVSAFGFGGINYHVVLEEADSVPSGRTQVSVGALPSLPLGLPVIAFGAGSKEALAAEAQQLLDAGLDDVDAVAHACLRGVSPGASAWRVAFHAEDSDGAGKRLEALVANLGGTGSAAKLEALGVALRGPDDAAFGPGEVAFLFPGQGSQYVGMLSEFGDKYPIVRETLAEADAIMAPILDKALTEYISPPEGTDPSAAFFSLMQTEVLQPAMLACNEALRRLLDPVVKPRVVLGHSLGEYAACVAADVLDFGDALRIVAARGDAMESVSLDDNGLMLGVNRGADEVEAALVGIEGYVAVVNKNCPSQTIVGGATPAVMAAQERLVAAGAQCMVLPVSHAFHSEIVAPAGAPLRRALDRIDVRAPKVPLLSNVTGGFYPEDAEDPAEWARTKLAEQVASPVEFIRNVESAYEAGCRVFIEVGPKRALTGFVGDILKGRPHSALYLAHPKFGELNTLGRTLASLVVDGVLGYGVAGSAEAETGTEIETRLPQFRQVAASAATQRAAEERAARTAAARAPAAAQQIQPAVPGAAASTPVAADAGASVVTAVIAGQALAAQTAASEVTKDPRFWQFVALQGPALMDSLAASYRAALALSGQALPVAGLGAGPHIGAAPTVQPYAQVAAAAPAPQTADAGYSMSVAPVAGDGTGPAATHASGLVKPRSNGAGKAIVGGAPDTAFAPIVPGALQHARVPPPATTPVAPAGDLGVWVQGKVAEATGYDVSELDMDADIEADLGIDSIRQIEIIIGIRDELGLEADKDFQIGQHSTLRQLSDYLSALRGDSGTTGSEPETAEATGRPADLSAWVLAQVAEVTGYGLDELDVDADIEADLGIDSIRQIEIVLGIRDSLGLEADDSFNVGEHATLGQLIGYLQGRLDDAPQEEGGLKPPFFPEG